jgi:hypothetical protein
MKNLKKTFAITLFFVMSSACFAGDWDSSVIEKIDVKQAAFCNLVKSYQAKAETAAGSKNQIKQMAVSQEQSDDLKALIQDRKFENWIAQVDGVELYKTNINTKDKYNVRLSANLGCGGSNIIIHSSMKPGDKKIGETTTPVLFKQLAKVSSGEFVLISGEFRNDFQATEFCKGSRSCSQIEGAASVQTTFATTYDTLVTFK